MFQKLIKFNYLEYHKKENNIIYPLTFKLNKMLQEMIVTQETDKTIIVYSKKGRWMRCSVIKEVWIT